MVREKRSIRTMTGQPDVHTPLDARGPAKEIQALLFSYHQRPSMTDPSPPPVESISPPDLRESSLSSSPHEQNEGEFAEDPPVRRQTTARKLYSYTWSNRKNEQARFKSLMNDPFLLPGSLNPHNAHCIACRQLVNLGTKRPCVRLLLYSRVFADNIVFCSYQTSMWIKHRDSCAQVKALRDQGFGQRPTDVCSIQVWLYCYGKLIDHFSSKMGVEMALRI